MKIKLSDVIDEKIKNKEVLETLNIKFFSIYITRRRLSFVDGTIRMKEDEVPTRLGFTFYHT